MSHLVDATFVIDLFTRQAHAEALLPTLLADGFGVSVVTEGEPVHAVDQLGRRDLVSGRPCYTAHRPPAVRGAAQRE